MSQRRFPRRHQESQQWSALLPTARYNRQEPLGKLAACFAIAAEAAFAP
jgi:hypothetical protein